MSKSDRTAKAIDSEGNVIMKSIDLDRNDHFFDWVESSDGTVAVLEDVYQINPDPDVESLLPYAMAYVAELKSQRKELEGWGRERLPISVLRISNRLRRRRS